MFSSIFITSFIALVQSEASILGHWHWFNMGYIGIRNMVIITCLYTTSLGGSVHSHWPMDVHRLLFLMEISIAASIMEPVASAVTRFEARAAFSSTRAASSAYSNLLTRIALSASPTTIPELGTSCSLKILSRPAMKHTGENISPCNTPRSMLNGYDNTFSPLGCLMRTTPVAAAKIAWIMRLTLTLIPASARALSRKS